MSFAPQQDWSTFSSLTGEHDRAHLRQLTLDQKRALYADLYRLTTSQTLDREGQDRLALHRWHEKLAMRKKMLDAFRSDD